MLGSQIERLLAREGVETVSSDRDVDITDSAALRAFAEGKKIGWIINCSAYTAVDKAESEEELARKINAQGVGNIAAVAESIGAKVIHFSTDYVFDGSAGHTWKETDEPSPLSAYGRTKLEGETLLRKGCPKHFILRISWLYGIFGPNFVKTMVRLMKEKDQISVVNDQVGSPTFCGKLAENVVNLVKSDSESYGTYHYSDEGVISWYDFACRIQEIAFARRILSRRIPVNPIPTSAYPSPAKRPANSAFDKAKVKSLLGFDVRKWNENLEIYFAEWVASEPGLVISKA
jgi:dTDP-4-dehydrorhamnose reductase